MLWVAVRPNLCQIRNSSGKLQLTKADCCALVRWNVELFSLVCADLYRLAMPSTKSLRSVRFLSPDGK